LVSLFTKETNRHIEDVSERTVRENRKLMRNRQIVAMALQYFLSKLKYKRGQENTNNNREGGREG